MQVSKITFFKFLKNYQLPIPADFPKTADGRVYHLGVRAGEVANRIVSQRLFHSPASFSKLIISA